MDVLSYKDKRLVARTCRRYLEILSSLPFGASPSLRVVEVCLCLLTPPNSAPRLDFVILKNASYVLLASYSSKPLLRLTG